MTIIVRPITLTDYPAYETFAFTSKFGITSLPKDPHLLKSHIEYSLEAFKENGTEPAHQIYLFILEDLKTGRLLGTSRIKAQTAVTEPNYTYLIANETHHSLIKEAPESLPILKPIKHEFGPSEICGLYLMPRVRGEHLGRLLSLSRFLFIANFPGRFSESLFAEMRGYFNHKGENLFWEKVGRQFYDVSYEEATAHLSRSTAFVKDILPHYPIYFSLLPSAVQKVIGRVHPRTEPALAMLQKIGMQSSFEVDILGAGPKISAPTDEITLIHASQVFPLSHKPSLQGPTKMALMANTTLSFRATIAHYTIDEGEILLDPSVSEALLLQPGDPVRIFPL